MKASVLLRLSAAFLLASVALSAAAQNDVQALADRWTESYNAHDSDGLARVYTADAELVVHGSTTIAGRAAIENYWAADFEDRSPLTLLTVTHSVDGVDMILVHGDYEVVNREDGSQLGQGRFAHVWRRVSTSSEWQLDFDLWSEYFDPYEADPQTDSEVQALADRWVNAYNLHDRAALAAVYTDEADLMLHGGPTLAGRTDIGDFWAEDFQEGNPLTLLTVTHALEGADRILVHGNYRVIDRENGMLLGAGRFSHIWSGDRRLQSDWQLDRDLWYERFPVN
jgi:uncharacterized protein (TIGR02246 family)